MNLQTKEELENLAKAIRIDIANMTHNSGLKGAHLGGSNSIADILAVLYGCIMDVDPANPAKDERDRVILSKAHAAMALYSVLHHAGFIPKEAIDSAMHGVSPLYEHPKKNPAWGIESSGGSLGMGLSFGMGMGLALKKKGNEKSRVYVIIGDGECDEGSIWEAASAIIHYGLNNVIPIIDENLLQYDGRPSEVMRIGDMNKRWESVGFKVINVDGHDVMALKEVFSAQFDEPTVVIARTVKGKGVSYAEDKVEWHSNQVTDELLEIALKEL